MRRWPEQRAGASVFALALAFPCQPVLPLCWRDGARTYDLVANAPVITIDLAPVPVVARDYARTKSRQARSSRKREPEPEPEKPAEEAGVCRRIRRLSRYRPLYRRPKSRSRPRTSPSRSTRASRARPALPRQDPERAAAPMPGCQLAQPECSAELEVAAWWPSSSATSAIRPRRNHAVSRVLRSLHSASTAAVACIMHASCRARDRVRSIKQPWRWSDARHRCRRLRRKSRVAKFRSSVPIRYNAR